MTAIDTVTGTAGSRQSAVTVTVKWRGETKSLGIFDTMEGGGATAESGPWAVEGWTAGVSGPCIGPPHRESSARHCENKLSLRHIAHNACFGIGRVE